jgi:hypothetical protein
MPLPLTTAARNALAAGNVALAWLLTIETDEETLRGWDKNISISYGGHTYEPLGEKFSIAGTINMGVDLVPEQLSFTFDGVDQSDDASFIGRLLDNSWHQRRVTLVGLVLNPATNFTQVIGEHITWKGWLDTIKTADAVGAVSQVTLNCESGVFRALDFNPTTCSDADQKRRLSSDQFFRNVALKPQQDVPFGTGWSNIPGGGSGRGGSGGGGSGGGRLGVLK